MNILVDLAAFPLVAHRGASAEAPENTLPAFERAAELRVDAFEFDVRLTADGEVVVHHDPTLDRTTDLRGPLIERTLDQLRAGTNIPTLDEVLGAFPSMPMLIELKEVAGQEQVRDVILRHDAASQCLVASEYHDALECFRDGRFLVGASRKDILRLLVGSATGTRPRKVAYHALSVPDRHHFLPVATRRFIANAHALGCPVHIWTVDDPAEADELRARGANGILTNDPAKLAMFGTHARG
ncbi:MAG: glycerophosphodiester phosphodiesterase family protein [Gemmatimonadales bacterium]